jgi:tetratricopeptide (TPR) repeat protein
MAARLRLAAAVERDDVTDDRRCDQPRFLTVRRQWRAGLRRGALTLAAAATLGAIAATVGGCSLFDPGPTRGEALDAEFLVLQAEGLRADGANDAAMLLLLDALEVNPRFTRGQIMLGQMARERGDLRTAERAFTVATTQEPENFDAQFGLGDVLLELGRSVEAVRAFLQAVRLRPDEQAARRGLAAAYLDLEEARPALPHAQRAVELDPNDPLARVNLGTALSLLGQHERAIEQYETAAELAEPTHALLINWANSLGVLGRFEEMAIIAASAIGIDETATAYERLGFARFKMREFNQAALHFRTAIDIDPRHHPALNGLGIIMLNRYLASDRQSDNLRLNGLSLLKRSLRVRPDQARITDLVSRFERG